MNQVWQIFKLVYSLFNSIIRYFSGRATLLSNFFYAHSVGESVLLKELVDDYEKLKSERPAMIERTTQEIALMKEEALNEIREMRKEELRLIEVMREETLQELEVVKNREINNMLERIASKQDEQQASFTKLEEEWKKLEAQKKIYDDFKIHKSDLDITKEELENSHQRLQRTLESEVRARGQIEGLSSELEKLSARLNEIAGESLLRFEKSCEKLHSLTEAHLPVKSILESIRRQVENEISINYKSARDLINNEGFRFVNTMGSGALAESVKPECAQIEIKFSPEDLQNILNRSSQEIMLHGLDHVEAVMWLGQIYAWLEKLGLGSLKVSGEEEYVKTWNSFYGSRIKTNEREVELALYYDLNSERKKELEKSRTPLLLALTKPSRYSEEEISHLMELKGPCSQLNKYNIFYWEKGHGE